MSFPRNDINPALKNDKWLLQYAKEVWAQKGNTSIFYANAEKYKIYRSYAMGMQSIDKYKPIMGVDENADNSHWSIDWSVRPIVSKYRDIGISKLHQREYNITATPIDPLAKDEADKYYADIKARILMKQVAEQAAPELAQSPALMKANPAEPEDLEELEMHMDYGFKSQFALEAEQGIDLVFSQNEIQNKRRRVLENLFDYGVAGYKECIENGRVTFRDINPENVITNYCRKGDFSDLVYCAEVINVPLVELAGILPDDVLKKIAEKAKSYSKNSSAFNETYDECTVQVLDLELLSDDEKVYKQGENVEGNYRFKKTKYDNYNPDEKTKIAGEMQNKYFKKRITNVYRVKWIVDTEVVYDAGLGYDMKREPDKKLRANTCLSYHLFAYNFDKMRAQGMMERLIPIIDEYQLTVYKVQNFKNKWIPYVIEIDLDAIENVPLGKGGKNLDPMAVMDLMFQNHIAAVRKQDMSGQNINYKAIDIVPTNMQGEFVALAGDLSRLLQDMRDITGLNEITDGSTPSDRMLNGVASMANAATNNALYPMLYAEKTLLEKLAKGVIQRLQIAVQNGDVEGITRALGTGTVKFLKVTDAIAPYVYGIIIEDRPTDEQKQMLLQQLAVKDQQGLVDPDVYIKVMNCRNLKQAQIELAYYVKKKQEQQQQIALQNTQATAQAQMQSAQAKAQADQQTLQLEYQLKMQLMNLQKQWDMKIAEMNGQVKAHATVMNHDAKIGSTMMQTESAERQQQAEVGAQPQMVDDFGEGES
jgi:hypothetical protein